MNLNFLAELDFIGELELIQNCVPLVELDRIYLYRELFHLYNIIYPDGYVYGIRPEQLIHPRVWEMYEMWFNEYCMVDYVNYCFEEVEIIEAVRFDFRYRLCENVLNEFGAPNIVYTESVHVPLMPHKLADFTVLSAMQVLLQYASEHNWTGIHLFNLITNGEITIQNRPLLMSSYNIIAQHQDTLNAAQTVLQDSLPLANDLDELAHIVQGEDLPSEDSIFLGALLFVGGTSFLYVWLGPHTLKAWDIPMQFPEGF